MRGRHLVAPWGLPKGAVKGTLHYPNEVSIEFSPGSIEISVAGTKRKLTPDEAMGLAEDLGRLAQSQSDSQEGEYIVPAVPVRNVPIGH